jgi:hypothetical protein
MITPKFQKWSEKGKECFPKANYSLRMSYSLGFATLNAIQASNKFKTNIVSRADKTLHQTSQLRN